MHTAAKTIRILVFFLLSLGLLPAGRSAAQQAGPVFTLDRDRGILRSSAPIYQSVTISLTRSAGVIESTTRPSPFSSYQFLTSLQPGDQITLKAGDALLYEAGVIPINLALDLTNGQISGQAFPGQSVETTVQMYIAGSTDTFSRCWDERGVYPYRFTLQTTAMPDGTFTLSSALGLRPGDTGSLVLYDAAGNQQIQAFNTGDIIALNIQRHMLEGQFFSAAPEPAIINITIHDPDGALLWSTSMAYSSLNNSQFNLSVPVTVPLLPGAIIQVTDGVKTKQMVVPRIALDRLLGSRSVTGRVEIPGGDAAPSGYLVVGWFEFNLYRRVDHCREGPVDQGVFNVSFSDEPFAALNEVYLTFEDGNGNFFSNGYMANSLILTKDRPEPVYGIFSVGLELRNTAFTLDHTRAGRAIGSYSGLTDTWGYELIQTGPDVMAQEGDRVVVSVQGEALVDVTVPKLSATADPLNNAVIGQVTSQAPDLVHLMADLQRVNSDHQDIHKTVWFTSTLDGSFIFQPQAGETWETPDGQPARAFQIDACTQVFTLNSQAPGGHLITWHGPPPANAGPDAYEPDSNAQTARPYTGPQRHTMLTGSDEDRVAFEITPANAGEPVTFTTQDMGWGMAVDLTLYATGKPGAEELVTKTLTEGSEQSFSYTFDTPGIYQARIRGRSSAGFTFGGCDSAYTLSIQPPAPLRSSTHLSLSGSLPSPVYPGQKVTLHFDLAPGLPSGTPPGGVLTLSDSQAGSSPLCQAEVSGPDVDCTLAFSDAGSHTLTAGYSGDDRYEPSTSAEIRLTVSPFNTSTGLSASPQAPVSGETVVLTARVEAQPPGSAVTGGPVTFYEGDRALGKPVPLVDGAAHLELAGLPVGTHRLIAEYAGALNFTGSRSPGLEVVVEEKGYSVFIPVVLGWVE